VHAASHREVRSTADAKTPTVEERRRPHRHPGHRTTGLAAGRAGRAARPREPEGAVGAHRSAPVDGTPHPERPGHCALRRSLRTLGRARLTGRAARMGRRRELRRAPGQPVNLSRRQGDEIVYIERAVSERSGMQVVRAVGGRAPLHLTAVGKLFLAVDDPRNVRAYAARTGLAGHTKNSITDPTRLERELALVRARGYARDNEELELGVRCIAAGIRDDSGKLVAGLSISAPADFVQDEWIDQLCR